MPSPACFIKQLDWRIVAYDGMLIYAVQQHESATNAAIPSLLSLLSSLSFHPTLLSHHREAGLGSVCYTAASH